MFLFACYYLVMSLRSGRSEEARWRIAYVLAFGFGTWSFILPHHPPPKPWHPPSVQTLFGFPGILLWLTLVTGLYAVIGEKRAKKAAAKKGRMPKDAVETT